MGHTSHVQHVNEAAVDLHRDALWDIPQSQCLHQNKQKRKAGVSVLKQNKHFLKWMKAADDLWSLGIASYWVSKETGRAAVITVRIPPISLNCNKTTS